MELDSQNIHVIRIPGRKKVKCRKNIRRNNKVVVLILPNFMAYCKAGVAIMT